MHSVPFRFINPPDRQLHEVDIISTTFLFQVGKQRHGAVKQFPGVTQLINWEARAQTQMSVTVLPLHPGHTACP